MSSKEPTHPVAASALGGLASWCQRHRRWVLLGWIATIVILVSLSQVAGTAFTDVLQGGNSASTQVQNLLARTFPQTAGASVQVVFHGATPLTSPTESAKVDRVLGRLRSLPDVREVTRPTAADHQLAPNGTIGFATINFDLSDAALPDSVAKAVVSVVQRANGPGFEAAVAGNVISRVVTAAPGSSEGIGITAAMIIMLVAFGSLVAMGLPIVTALAGIAVGFAVQDLLSHLLTVPTFAPEMLAMLGLGVGIDYALFIVTRYRQGLRDGEQPGSALALSLATAGRAVAFAGMTVVISLFGLFLVNISFMIGLAVGAILAVMAVLTAALTLLPALLGYIGRTIDGISVPGLGGRSGTTDGQGFWFRWSRAIQARPWPFALTALGLLVALAIPLFSMRLAFTDSGNDPTNLTTRQAYDLLAQGFGPGFNGPLLIAVELPAVGSGAGLSDLDQAIQETPGVAFAAAPQISPTGRTGVIVAYPTGSPQSAEAADLVTNLRTQVIPRATVGTGIHALVGGETAAGIDASNYLSERLPWVIGGVIFLALLLLLAVFRSVIIPVKAAVMNLLSVGAAYGVIVAVFQWGWAGSVIGIGNTGPIDPWIPLMLFTVLFGLSMDYEVFLLSRIREEWRRTGDNSMAVADGLARTARVITAAAAIMVCVFGSFVIGDPLHVLKVFGLGLAAAVLIDATLVRMVLVPSVMEILGSTNWYIPRWMDRVVPTLGVEVEVESPAVRGVRDHEPVMTTA